MFSVNTSLTISFVSIIAGLILLLWSTHYLKRQRGSWLTVLAAGCGLWLILLAVVFAGIALSLARG